MRHTDNLSRTLQKGDMSAAAGQEVMLFTLSTLKAIRDDSSFELFWHKVCASAEEVDVGNPTLPRRRKVPRRIDDGAAATFPETVEEYYRPIYFEAIDLITSRIADRFDQPGYKTYRKVQALLLKAAASQPYDEELKFVISFYGSDFDPPLLSTHLEIFSQNYSTKEKQQATVLFSDNYYQLFQGVFTWPG